MAVNEEARSLNECRAQLFKQEGFKEKLPSKHLDFHSSRVSQVVVVFAYERSKANSGTSLTKALGY